ncbi:MAG TPA: helix-turn-helix transcriptional regulator [Acidobacteriota bacterium]|jgi:MerR family transcriptional regulator/heat shock protein HspR
MKKERRSGYTISAVAAMYQIHPQTLRLYEREGLLKPSRSRGNTRLYEDQDLQRLDLILSLTRDLGVNLAGVDVILNMRERMVALQREVNELFQYMQCHLEQDETAFREKLRNSLVPLPPTKIVRVRRGKE